MGQHQAGQRYATASHVRHGRSESDLPDLAYCNPSEPIRQHRSCWRTHQPTLGHACCHSLEPLQVLRQPLEVAHLCVHTCDSTPAQSGTHVSELSWQQGSAPDLSCMHNCMLLLSRCTRGAALRARYRSVGLWSPVHHNHPQLRQPCQLLQGCKAAAVGSLKPRRP